MKNAININYLFRSSLPFLALVMIMFILFVMISRGQSENTDTPPTIAATGGSFTLTKIVGAGGGREKSAVRTFFENGTAGQAAAGRTLTGGPFTLRSGFWTPELVVNAPDVGSRDGSDCSISKACGRQNRKLGTDSLNMTQVGNFSTCVSVVKGGLRRR